jgi:glyoxylase-like metal-dependent hydrolase (beta-lactamase superfamily II)
MYQKITDNVYHIHESLNAYCSLILGSESALLIDTGFGLGDIYTKVRGITGLPLKVVNTHGHIDHIQGNKQFHSIMLHKEDRLLYQTHSSLLKKIGLYLFNRKSIKGYGRKGLFSFFKKNNYNIKFISDGDIIDLGDNGIEVIHTPGHTKGSLCLLDKKSRILFSGDSFSSHIWLCLPESTSVKTFIESTKIVIKRQNEFDKVISSHSFAVFKASILIKIRDCAEHLSVENSRTYYTPLSGKALIYKEGFEGITKKYGFNNFDDFIAHLDEVSLEDISEIAFTSIVYKNHRTRS